MKIKSRKLLLPKPRALSLFISAVCRVICGLLIESHVSIIYLLSKTPLMLLELESGIEWLEIRPISHVLASMLTKILQLPTEDSWHQTIVRRSNAQRYYGYMG